MKNNFTEIMFNTRVNSPFNMLYLPKKAGGKSYCVSPDQFNPNPGSAHGIILRNIDEHTKVLDVGCANGFFGEFLKLNKGCWVYGLELDQKSVNSIIDRGCFDKVVCCDLENLQNDSAHLIQDGFCEFDFIICADVLEHIKNINEIFLSLTKMLKPGGRMIVSVPNINHVDIVYNLIRGRFNYAPSGILDSTHLRFFTRKSFVEWVTLLAQDNGIRLAVDLLGQVSIEQIVEPDERIEAEARQILEMLFLAYKTIGESSECLVLQNVFSITCCPV